MAIQIYTDADGKRLPSVTSIINRFKESGGLLYWANKCGLNGQTLDDARREAVTPGSIVHQMVRDHICGRDVIIPQDESDTSARVRTAYANYLKWEAAQRITFRHVEFPLCSARHRFGGTFDAIGLIGNDLAILDWKCANSIYADYLYQLAAYTLLWEENYPDHPLTGGAHLCRFAKENADFSHYHYGNLRYEAETFLLMRELYDRVKETERRAR